MTVDFLSLIFIAIGGLIGAGMVALFLRGRKTDGSDNSALNSELATLRAQKTALQTEKEQLQSELTKTREELSAKRERIAALEANQDNLNQRIAQHKSDMDQMQNMMKEQFKNLAHEIFEEKTTKFTQASGAQMQQLLEPLKEGFKAFNEKLNSSEKEQASLKTEIQNIVSASDKMRLETENLSKALKGDSKVQGDWGEILLERILEESGLRKGIDYTVQGSGMNLKHPETGTAQKPDFIVHLPENKHIIIDSKVSITSYERYISELDDAARGDHASQYLASVRNHVKGLKGRRYQDTDGLGTPDFILMFVPTEGAYSLAVQQDARLHPDAWNERVVIVCPSTLFATLRTISSVWKLDMQNKNVQEIANQAAMLYDKVVGFCTDMENIETHLNKAQQSYSQAFKKLSDGRGSITNRIEKLKELGAKTSKSIPDKFLTDAEMNLINTDRDAA